MKNIISGINKLFESRIRLGIMSVLMVNEEVDFNSLKELLKLTDGNLASHLTALEKHELILVRKEFVGRKTRTSYAATRQGKKAFSDHLAALENLIKQQK
ncbi:MAG: transcriptional regulator [Bacteroidales bacterium]